MHDRTRRSPGEPGPRATELGREVDPRNTAGLELLRRIHGDRKGFLHLAAGVGPHVNDSGSVAFDGFPETSVLWPKERDKVEEWLTAHAEHDCYFTPELSANPLRKADRRKALPARWVRVDLDHKRPVPELGAQVAVSGGIVVASGRPGYTHQYIRLADDVSPAIGEDLNRRLAARFDGDPAPTWHGAYMRLPHGVNTKRLTLGEVTEPDRPKVLKEIEGPGASVEELRALCPEETPGPALAVEIDGDKVAEPDELPERVAELRDEKVTTDRSAQSYALAGC